MTGRKQRKCHISVKIMSAYLEWVRLHSKPSIYIVDQAFELEFDGESHLFLFMMQSMRVVWDEGGKVLTVCKAFSLFLFNIVVPRWAGSLKMWKEPARNLLQYSRPK